MVMIVFYGTPYERIAITETIRNRKQHALSICKKVLKYWREYLSHKDGYWAIARIDSARRWESFQACAKAIHRGSILEIGEEYADCKVSFICDVMECVLDTV